MMVASRLQLLASSVDTELITFLNAIWGLWITKYQRNSFQLLQEVATWSSLQLNTILKTFLKLLVIIEVGRHQLTFHLWKSLGFSEHLSCPQREEGPFFPRLKSTYFFFPLRCFTSGTLISFKGKILALPQRYSLVPMAHIGLAAGYFC